MIQIEVLYDYFKKSSGIVTDSRKVTEGSIFFALRGDNFDGNDFVEAALEQGARYAVSDRPSIIGDRVLIVDDSLDTLQKLAAYHRSQFNIPVIGITGSCGKTTTKELTKCVLAQKFNVTATKDNFNNHIGVPMSLLSIDEKTQIAVIEMGANAPGEIEALVRIVQPTCGIITNVEKVHLEGFGSFEGVKKTKGELYDYLRQKGFTAFVNNDNQTLNSMIQSRAGLCTTKYGLEYQGAEVIPATAESPYLKVALPVVTTGKNVKSPSYKLVPKSEITEATDIKVISTRLIGDYNADNILAALAIGTYFEVPLIKCISAIESYIPANNRSQMVNTGKNTVIVDTYNANPKSMRVSLENFGRSNFPHTVLILGEMKEIGETSMDEHIAIINLAETVSSQEDSLIYLVGDGMIDAIRSAAIPYSNISCFDNADTLKEHLSNHPLEGRTVFIKGSHSNHLEKVLELL